MACAIASVVWVRESLRVCLLLLISGFGKEYNMSRVFSLLPYICVCICVCKLEREGDVERERELVFP